MLWDADPDMIVITGDIIDSRNTDIEVALQFVQEAVKIAPCYQHCQDVVPIWQYSEAYSFALDVIPQYLSGGEAETYIQREIIPLFPKTLKKAERKKAIKAKIKEEFKSEKGYPCWVQSSDWPLGSDGKPMTYVKKGKRIGSKYSWIFRDESNGTLTVVEQFD